jgi:hypothetical protein
MENGDSRVRSVEMDLKRFGPNQAAAELLAALGLPGLARD